ncbi:orotate phosphoribosyltransferase [Pallidibacillus pasinlerensis]|uniref:Orotate phosphoribosyltransferase n=1 Tax=Pallidibacillus pasinlerensis TaxID=2703818 RepID=A0ABX0A111_9BACI|nr:orotate phosphoribosyltransferase [Pallidibacillus pasinlerensis]NCU16221.1 orotate phosphoribosyltransferase [Pallidibacillus pasinlerensis]
MMSTQQFLADKLLEIGAVSLSPNDPYTWASGIKSPIYCDNRLTLGYPTLRKEIAKEMTKLIKTHFSDVQLIAGTATAGIPHAAWVSDIMNLPLCYVRSSSKGHGKQNQIEGHYFDGQKAVVIEDLISTGKSSVQAAIALKDAGVEVLGVVSIFTYELPEAVDQFEQIGIPYYSLTSFSTLLDTATENGKITEAEKKYILKWKENPRVWG